MNQVEKLEKELDELYEQQENVTTAVESIANFIKEGIIPKRVVTSDYPSFESFVGNSYLETADDTAGFIMRQEESDELIFVQHLSDDKQIWTYFVGTKINKTEFLVLDTELDTQKKKCEKIEEYGIDLTVIQNKIDEVEGMLAAYGDK
ncbi:hypothetical protein [Enterococcus sp. BWR-S5]|uniref:hypothetical protein n=1 Tax=Enterococcus sp. BWR-S5 TaxID=2787714 RepID=UPI0019211755|nr:hypothetical protein [Enterococcus sp. BWR-S5]MBL1223713.1 hypothetical protein [Enterococcus sp. BWR-S5]